ncbi:DUF4244 domain-containing protein [Demequina oxidasica]|uniref:DUF4244 domain-containing protein n=1 Tax=Demequina oxidasica TaxID=676199 RepID=UPI000A0181D1|nr:DUF4244 domain-containing protein [Demequina oxidasica]
MNDQEHWNVARLTEGSAGSGSSEGQRTAGRGARGDDLRNGTRRSPTGDDRGMATAEYALVTVAAAGFAGLLIVLLKSSEVRELLMGIIQGALAG